MKTGCGHGHVYPMPNGVKARCGGPKICSACAKDFAELIGTTLCEGMTASDFAPSPYAGRFARVVNVGAKT